MTDVQECGNVSQAQMRAPEGETIVTQSEPGSPSRAAFARVGVLEP
jgi:hypothetical protein